MKRYLLGIDVGTSGCKCCVLDIYGGVLRSTTTEYDQISIKPGWVEQDPRDWYKAALTSLRRLSVDLDLKDVAAVGTTGQMRGPTLLNGEGRVVRNSILWNDLRCAPQVERLNRNYSDLLRKVTANPMNTMCTLPKLMWLMENEPENWRRTDKVLYPKDYVNYRLTGAIQTDRSDASGSSCYDLLKQTWSEEIASEFGIDMARLPPIRSSVDVIGQVSQIASRESGLQKGIPVVAGGSDSTVESISIGLVDSSQCKIRLGSSGALSTIVDKLDGVNPNLACWSYVLPGRWMIDTNTRSCGQSIVWLRDKFYPDREKSIATYAEIEKDANRSPPGSNGLFFHPYLLGEDSPYFNPNLRASLFGLSAGHKRSDIARTVYEGTAFALRDASLTLGGVGKNFQRCIFVGGGVKNPLWLSIVSDVLGVDGVVPVNADAAFGAAMLAGIGLGAFTSTNEAVDKCLKIERHIRHNEANSELYNSLYERYKKMKYILDQAYEK